MYPLLSCLLCGSCIRDRCPFYDCMSHRSVLRGLTWRPTAHVKNATIRRDSLEAKYKDMTIGRRLLHRTVAGLCPTPQRKKFYFAHLKKEIT